MKPTYQMIQAVVNRVTKRFYYTDKDYEIMIKMVGELESIQKSALVKGVGPNVSGVYALYHRGPLVYIGKASKGTTTSKRTLRSRLNEHVCKIRDRSDISLEDMECRYLTFESEWKVFAAESALISYYKPEWNGSGFGSKPAGRGRLGTGCSSLWDKTFPRLPLDTIQEAC